VPDTVSLPDPPLLIITDRQQARRPLAEIASTAFDAGARWISIREKDLPAPEQLALLERIADRAPEKAVVGSHGAPHAALDAAGAWHLPGDADLSGARLAVRPGALVGKSCHTLEEVRAAARDGAYYVSLSPVFLTDSKPGYGPAVGLDQVQQAAAIVKGTGCHLIALGGVTQATIGDCRRAGADGAAVMGEVMRSDDPGATVQALIAAWRAAA